MQAFDAQSFSKPELGSSTFPLPFSPEGTPQVYSRTTLASRPEPPPFCVVMVTSLDGKSTPQPLLPGLGQARTAVR
jgi:hypothetical protein